MPTAKGLVEGVSLRSLRALQLRSGKTTRSNLVSCGAHILCDRQEKMSKPLASLDLQKKQIYLSEAGHHVYPQFIRL